MDRKNIEEKLEKFINDHGVEKSKFNASKTYNIL